MDYCAALIGTLSANQINNGFWSWYGVTINPSPVTFGVNSSGSDDPWMQSYLAEAVARAKILFGGESFGSSITTFCSMHRKYFEGILGGTFCDLLSSAQTINVKNGSGNTTFKSNWAEVGKFPGTFVTDVWMFASFLDIVNGWISIFGSDGTTPLLPAWPFDVGSKIVSTADYFNGTVLGNAAPSPVIMETQTYYVVAVDTTNKKIKVSTTSGGPAVISVATQSRVLWNILDSGTCPAAPTSLAGIGEPFGNMANLVRAVRSYRTAADNAALKTADRNGTNVLAANSGANFSTWPMGKVTV
jgi:hypothetical protein